MRSAMSAQTLKLSDARPPRNLDQETRRRIRSAIDASFQHAFRIDMLIAAALAVASVGAALAIRRTKGRDPGSRSDLHSERSVGRRTAAN